MRSVNNNRRSFVSITADFNGISLHGNALLGEITLTSFCVLFHRHFAAISFEVAFFRVLPSVVAHKNGW